MSVQNRLTARGLATGALLIAAALVASLSACSVSQPATSQSHLDFNRLPSIERDMKCKSSIQIHDDLSFWDSARGLDCIYGPNSGIVLRVYAHDRSPAYVVPDWKDLISANNEIIGGSNWFALGSKRQLAAAFKHVKTDYGPRTTEPTWSVPALSDQKKEMGNCSSFAASGLEEQIQQNLTFAPELQQLDAKFPGISSFVQKLATPSQRAEMAALSNGNEGDLQAYITQFGPKIKGFCARVVS